MSMQTFLTSRYSEELLTIFRDLEEFIEGKPYPDEGEARKILKSLELKDSALNLVFLYHSSAAILVRRNLSSLTK